MWVFNQVDPTEKAKKLNNSGVTLLEAGKVQEALDLFNKAIEQDEKIGLIWNHRGLALSALKKHADACVSFERAESIARDNLEFKTNRAYTLINMEKFEEAEKLCESVLSKNSDDANALYIKGACRMKSIDFPEALKVFRKLMKVPTTNFKGDLEGVKKSIAMLEGAAID
jgi:tetratricopeptide (TPR) repeat protein